MNDVFTTGYWVLGLATLISMWGGLLLIGYVDLWLEKRCFPAKDNRSNKK